MADETIDINLGVDPQPATRSIRSIRQEIKALEATALEAGIGTKLFTDSAAKAGTLKKELDNMNKSIDALAGNTAQKLTKSFGEVSKVGVAGFESVMGAQALFGDSTEKLEEQMVKLQAVMAFSRGIKELSAIGEVAGNFKTVIASIVPQLFAQTAATEGATVAQEGLNIAMNLSPVGLIVLGIVALVAAFAIFKGSQETAAEKQAKINELEQEHIKLIEEEITQIKKLKSMNDTNLEFDVELAKTQKKSLETIRDLEKKAVKDKLADLSYVQGFRGNLTAEELQEKTKLTNELTLIDAKYREDRKDADDKAAEKKQKEDEKWNKKHQELLDKRKKLEAELAKKALEEQQANDALELSNTTNLVAQTLKLKQDEELRLAATEQERLDIKKQRDKDEIEAEYAKTDLGVAAQQAKTDALLLIDSKYYDDTNTLKIKQAQDDADAAAKKVKDEEAAAAKRKSDLDKEFNEGKKRRDESYKGAQDLESSIQSLSDLTFILKNSNLVKGSMAEYEAAKKQFDVNKKLSIASATITGIHSVMSAFANGVKNPVPLLGPITGAIYAAAAGAAAAANIAKISATQFTGSAPSVSGAVGTPTAPTSTTQQSSSQNFTAPQFFGLGKGTSNSGGGSQRVYVTETDITNTQNRVALIESRSVQHL